jgi:hypothetical protein
LRKVLQRVNDLVGAFGILVGGDPFLPIIGTNSEFIKIARPPRQSIGV